MKTTIYDLLGMIKDDNAPQKIVHNHLTFDYVDGAYYNNNYGFLFDNYYVEGILDDEVEILDEEDKIEKLSILTFSDLMDMEKEDLVIVIKEQRFKINKLIDEVNKLKENK